MTELQIKNDAFKALKNKDYPEAFNTLWELGVDGFIEFSQKEDNKSKKFNWFVKNWKSKGYRGYNYFWEIFILDPDVFTAIFTYNRAVEFLHNYYSKTDVFNQKIEEKLAREYPAIFIEAIRKNEVFFREDRIEFLLKDNLLNDDYLIHQDVWESFQVKELEIWKEIKENIGFIEEYSLECILFFTVKYIETNNFEADFDRINQATLTEVYSFFIDLILRNLKIKRGNINSDQFEMDFARNIHDDSNQELNDIVFKCLDLIKHRQMLNTRFFQPYCYNIHFQPKYIYESLCFYESPESHYQWNVDETRYKVSELVYQVKGASIVEMQLEKGAEIPSKHKSDYVNNKQLAFGIQATIETLNDLELTDFYINKVGSEKVKVKIEKLIKPIFAYSFNKYVRYYEPLKKIKAANVSLRISWGQALAYLINSNPKSLQLPFIYSSKQEYFDLNFKADEKFDIEIGSYVLDQFGFDSARLKAFDRFSIKYSVMETPFLLLENYIFSPVLFFMNFSNPTVYISPLLKNNNRRTAKKVETVLKDLLLIHNLKVKYPTDVEVNLIDGDADIIVFDDENALLIQIKRTNLRLDYKTQYNELINTDFKAANQLNDAEKSLRQNNKVFELGNRNITKWIVSNSFEKVGTRINDCLKINYLDIVSFLSNDEGMTFKNLPNFISYFESDNYFTTIAKPLIDNDDTFRRIFSLSNFNARNLVWEDCDVIKAKKYRHFYNKGLELNAKGENKNAVIAFKECLKLEDNDEEVHAAIANVYADLNDYDKALFHFDRALEIVPNNPFVLRNYQIALREAGNMRFLEVHSKLVKKFPLLPIE